MLPTAKDWSGFQIVASHCDSPTFKIKSNAEISVRGNYTQLNTEMYGGMLCASWMDRPLSVAGRIVVRTGDGVATRLVKVDRDMVLIPNVAIHMNRQANDGVKYNPQVDMLPLYGDGEASGGFLAEIASTAGVQQQEILDTDLFLYNRMPGTVWGKNGEYISAPKLDDLECAYTSLQAFLRCDVKTLHGIPLCCVFDNEEVGSTTKQGADSTLLYDVLRRITLGLGQTEEQYYTAVASSMMLSADNAHAVHPNHPELTDPTNQVFINKGIVIKYNARQKYTTDGVSGAIFKAICQRAGGTGANLCQPLRYGGRRNAGQHLQQPCIPQHHRHRSASAGHAFQLRDCRHTGCTVYDRWNCRLLSERGYRCEGRTVSVLRHR